MNRLTLFARFARWCFGLLALAAGGRAGASEEFNRLTEQERRAGWRLLWDGRSFAGWRGADPARSLGDHWKIADGVLSVVASGAGVARQNLLTEEDFSTFELTLQFRLTRGANSGVKYLVTMERNGGRVVPIGPEYQLLDDAVHPDAQRGVDGNRRLGSLYDLMPRRPGPVVPAGGSFLDVWQEARVIVRGDGTVEHWLNGEKLLAINRWSEDFRARVARSAYAKFPVFGAAAAGPILLQDHGDTVSFRALKVRRL